MVSNRDEINAAINTLGLPSQICRALLDAEGWEVFHAALTKFTGGDDRRWWWEAFSDEAIGRRVKDGWRLLTTLVPEPDGLVWFIAEDTDLPFYPVYETTPAAVERILGECFAFEYYLVAKDLSWLLCENHHDSLIGVGEPIVTRLAQLAL
jgi:hypothetical protein